MTCQHVCNPSMKLILCSAVHQSFDIMNPILSYSFSNDAYMFAFLEVERHLGWFRDVLRETASFPQNLEKINVQNCAGTVLAINGPRRYYTVYYPRRWRHQHGKRSIMSQMLGFVDTDSSDDADSFNDSSLQPDLVLRNFDAWMDRLYEGSLKRYRVEKWPVPSS